MLELQKIVKDYPAGDGTVHALKGISLRFRPSEFVSILGPSGCGKTTLLNMIGGLDQYTSGDLIINGKSTDSFRDRDWDTYRNHSVGFVFQTYNLIPHQSVLQNVELALTLSGVGKHERRKRAAAALREVGLGDQLKKKPSQLSGGQMQRVAIARALVNNPDIILADEPTGALDTETSVQVMEILQRVAADRLVIMVTHNPKLAKRYSTRIIKMLDGSIVSDSMPLSAGEVRSLQAADRQAREEESKKKKPAMKLGTAFGLSLKNLIAKRGRTILTSFAGSIGIIGIALIYAVSNGMTEYINTVQEDTLSSYPLRIEASSVDIGSLMSVFLENTSSRGGHDQDAVYSRGMIEQMLNTVNGLQTTENDLTAFRVWLEAERENEDSPLHGAISGLQYSYDLNLQIYTMNPDGTILISDAQQLMLEMMNEYMGADMSAVMQQNTGSGIGTLMSASMSNGYQVWEEMLPGDDGSLISPLLAKQYDLVYGSWPNGYDEVVLVLDEDNELPDITVYALGLMSDSEMRDVLNAARSGGELDAAQRRWSYEEICGMEFRAVLPGECYLWDETAGVCTDLRATDAGLRYLYDNGLKLRVTGIIRQSPDALTGMLSGNIGYTTALTRHLLEAGRESPAVLAQISHPETDVITGLPFPAQSGEITEAEKAAAFRDHIASLDEAGRAAAYVAIASIPNEEALAGMMQEAMAGYSPDAIRSMLSSNLVAQMGMDTAAITAYIDSMGEADLQNLFSSLLSEQVRQQYASGVRAQLAGMSDAQLAAALTADLPGYTDAQCAAFYDTLLTFSSSTYAENLLRLGCVDAASPSAISIYTATFENKDAIEKAIEQYNETVDEAHQIKYTDYVGLLISSVTTIINAITYVLIAFVAISLVVSSIMIGVVTLISVQERTKEIGILRAIGASKGNVSSMFNAETVLIGAASGLIGVGVTWLLCIPINAIIHHLTGIPNLSARLPVVTALILVGLSILLSVFAGFIPSRSAARKDPVVALRTE